MAAEAQWHTSLGITSRIAIAASGVRSSTRSRDHTTSRPTGGVCDVAFVFHIESGSFDGTALNGLHVALAVHAPGWSRSWKKHGYL